MWRLPAACLRQGTDVYGRNKPGKQFGSLFVEKAAILAVFLLISRFKIKNFQNCLTFFQIPSILFSRKYKERAQFRIHLRLKGEKAASPPFSRGPERKEILWIKSW